jgi:peptidoglycan/LPS O-acetylase OafA/YrhL
MTDGPLPPDGCDLQPGATQAPRRLAALDGLRGLAVLFVLLSHASKHFPVIHPALNFRGAGKFGVYLFFLLSAYLLDRQIALAMRRGERNYWGNYFLRRVLRVYPLFTVALVLHLLLTRLGITTVIETWQDVAAHLTLREGKGVFWSIPVEMTYYLVSPVILLICGLVLRWRPGVVFGFLAGLVAAAAWLSASGWLPTGSLIDYLPIFLMGAIIAVHEVLLPRQDQRGGLALDVAALVATAIILATIPAVSTALFGFRFRLNSAEMRLVAAACWATLLLAATRGSPLVRAVLERPGLRFLGMISFSAYLFHYPIITFVDGLPIPALLKFPLFMLLTLGLSFLTYSCIEKPLARIRLADLWRSGRNRDAVDDLSHVRTEPHDALVREGTAVEPEDRRG